MKQLKLSMCVLLAITILSCDRFANEPKVYDSFTWERTSITCSHTSSVAVENNGDVWASGVDSEALRTVVYLSTDNGDTWVKKGIFPDVSSITINPRNGYIFTSVSSYAGLFRSNNRGENWENIISINTHDILVTEFGGIYIGVRYSSYYKGVFYSSDNGNNWTQKSNGLPDEDVLSLALGLDGTLYAGTYNFGVYRSTNGGNTWLPSTNYTDVVISSLTVSNDGSIFATATPFSNRVTFNPPPPIGVLKSTDRGVTWYQVNTGLAIAEGVGVIMYNHITNEIFINTGAYLSRVIYRSTNLGASWELQNDGMANDLHISEFAYNPMTGQMFAATSDGVYRRYRSSEGVKEIQ